MYPGDKIESRLWLDFKAVRLLQISYQQMAGFTGSGLNQSLIKTESVKMLRVRLKNLGPRLNIWSAGDWSNRRMKRK